MPLVTREGKGSKLTIQEMDGNLTGLNSGQFVFDDFITIAPDLEDATGGFVGGIVTVPQVFDAGGFITALGDENYTAFLNPITSTDVDFKLFGHIIQIDVEDFFALLFSGILLSGEGIFGAGVLNVLNNPGTFATKIDSMPFYGEYVYGYDDLTGDHSHKVTLDGALANIIRTTFEITVNDTATSWGDVTVNTYTLATA